MRVSDRLALKKLAFVYGYSSTCVLTSCLILKYPFWGCRQRTVRHLIVIWLTILTALALWFIIYLLSVRSGMRLVLKEAQMLISPCWGLRFTSKIAQHLLRISWMKVRLLSIPLPRDEVTFERSRNSYRMSSSFGLYFYFGHRRIRVVRLLIYTI